MNCLPPLGRRALDRLLNPATIAVVGASPRPGSFGQRTLANLARFQGTVYPVNPAYQEINGLTCHPTVASLPVAPDCVVIAVPREHVEASVRDCIAARAGGIVVYTAGFSETGQPELVELQERLARLARAAGIPLVGPNCLGLFQAERSLSATFVTTSELTPNEGRPAIGLVSQSGAMGISLLQAAERGMRFSHLLTAGNSADVDIADLLAYLVEDEHCNVVVCLFEGIPDPRKLLAVGDAARRAGKPVLVYKFATGSVGAQAAMSHTGSIAGSNAGYAALFEAAGFVQLESLDDVLEAAAFFSKAGRYRSGGLGVLTGSGGAAILMADSAEWRGIALPQLAAAGQQVLDAIVPDFGAARNPCDLTAQAMNHPDAFPRACEAFLADDAIATIVVTHNTAGFGQERMPILSAQSRAHGKPVCIVWLSGWQEGPGATAIEADPHLCLFRSADRCAAILRLWMDWSVRGGRERGGEAPVARGDLPRLLAGPAGPLEDGAARELLALYGIPLVPQRTARTVEEAVAAAAALGHPVVAKLLSPDIPHKTEAGGVRLNLGDAAAVRQAFAGILESAGRFRPTARLEGVTVQPMAPRGVEICVGGRIDPQIGPLVTVAMGGVLIEVLQDARTALCPVDAAQAREMLLGLKGSALLRGFRGQAPVDLEQLAGIVSRVSQLLVDAGPLLSELDINPLICNAQGAVAVDVLALRGASRPHSKEEIA